MAFLSLIFEFVFIYCYFVLLIDSEEAAKGALLYTYKHAACGFSAKLTPEQVEDLSSMILFLFESLHFGYFVRKLIAP